MVLLLDSDALQAELLEELSKGFVSAVRSLANGLMQPEQPGDEVSEGHPSSSRRRLESVGHRPIDAPDEQVGGEVVKPNRLLRLDPLACGG